MAISEFSFQDKFLADLWWHLNQSNPKRFQADARPLHEQLPLWVL